MEVTFSNPIYLWGLIVVPIIMVLHFISLKYSRSLAIKFANFIALSRISYKIGQSYNVSVLIFRIISLVLIILAISGMTLWYNGQSPNKDYVLAIDTSSSMSSSDNFLPDRLYVAKETAKTFVDNLPLTSRVGVLSFSGSSFVHIPLNEDKSSVKEAIDSIKLNEVGGTDMGDAIITGTNLLSASKKQRTIVLITDGRSNIGVLQDTAILYAITNKVAINTIGIGSTNTSEELLGVDKEALMEISNLTSGSFYYISNQDDLTNAYDNLIKNPTEGKIPFDMTFSFLILAMIMLLIDWMLGTTIYKRIP